MLKLVAFAPDGVQRLPLDKRELMAGSGAACALRLPFPGVADRHALFRLDGGRLAVQGLQPRHPVLVNGRKVREATLQPLDEVRLGSITLLVEDDPETADMEPELPGPAQASGVPVPQAGSDEFLHHLARISDWVVADSESHTTLESLVSSLLVDLGGGVLYLFQGDLKNPVIKFVVATHAPWLTRGEEVLEQLRKTAGVDEKSPRRSILFDGLVAGKQALIFCILLRALERPYALVGALPGVCDEEKMPVAGLKTLGELLILGLVHHVGRYEPILPGRHGRQDVVLDSELMFGESGVSQRLLAQLRGAVKSSVQVLLIGEPGTGKQALARSLHLSGRLSAGSFVTADCFGAEDFQIEADLFGAEVKGRAGAIRREGKLTLAAGGTLFIDNVQRLPPKAQERLVRFLKSGEVEPPGGGGFQRADLRLVAAAPEPLDPLVGRNLFRADLAYLLSRCLIEVPTLRERKEELPLLIQGYMNRFCHEVGTRIQGITVKAMSALTRYPYPGNLPELEGIVRQLVSLCPPGGPIDTNLLPERVRRGALEAVPQLGSGSDLQLDQLVAACERSAIREALRRSGGNKSEAARLLGISRNGLQLKLRRHGIRE